MTRYIAAGAALVLATAADASAQVHSYYNPYTGTTNTTVSSYNPYLRGYTGYTTGYNFNTGTSWGGTGYNGLWGSTYSRGYSSPYFGAGGYSSGVTTPFYTGYQSGYVNPFATGYRAGYAGPFGGYRYGYGFGRW